MEEKAKIFLDETPIDLESRKKKYKTPVVGQDNIENPEHEIKEPRDLEAPLSQPPEDQSDFGSEIDFSFGKKKKKKKVTFSSEIHEPENGCNTVLHLSENFSISEECLAHDSLDYSYDYLLTRVFDLMRGKNPNLDDDFKKKLIMKPPQVFRAGAKKTSFANFLEICRILRRTPQHMQSFVLVELGTNGSVDSNGQLIIKGKFQQKQMENVLKRYIREYVTCHTCHSPETVLLKETRLCFLQCESCGSRCSVASIKSGFQAVVSKRAATRAKDN